MHLAHVGNAEGQSFPDFHREKFLGGGKLSLGNPEGLVLQVGVVELQGITVKGLVPVGLYIVQDGLNGW
ncbi:unannotated protein [freshwater metagenome]|uniref:Unannotated protein n=1 Tax=freshwater metagenome TaxID=449393 RepID=A0A6J7RZV0_9ZZZZ